VDRGLVPDWLCRQGIRRLLEHRLRTENQGSGEANRRRLRRLVKELKSSPLAIHPRAANEQHYEVPASFYSLVLGKRFKYSSCLWPEGTTTLDDAEEAMLDLSCKRAELEDGQSVLELGCGWGSLTLWMAERYPQCTILAMSNSSSQREFIMERARARQLSNLEVVTCDINDFQTDRRFDRVVCIEMFEHVRNYQILLNRIAGWLKPKGKLFTHIFCHRRFAYLFETEGADNWMGRHFFTGGIMPSDDLLLHFQDDLSLDERWRINGKNYARTARAWLDNMDRHSGPLTEVLGEIYGRQHITRWRVRWRLFFMACEELFGYRNGDEWQVSHYRFKKLGTTS
jgi:cyclopropane-fatty-acyl-phospholipid synthase